MDAELNCDARGGVIVIAFLCHIYSFSWGDREDQNGGQVEGMRALLAIGGRF